MNHIGLDVHSAAFSAIKLAQLTRVGTTGTALSTDYADYAEPYLNGSSR